MCVADLHTIWSPTWLGRICQAILHTTHILQTPLTILALWIVQAILRLDRPESGIILARLLMGVFQFQVSSCVYRLYSYLGSFTEPHIHFKRSYSVADNTGYSPEPPRFLLGSNANNDGFHHHDFIQNNRNAIPQTYPGASTNSARGVRSSYSQRPSPALRASSSNAGLRLGHPAPSDEGLQVVAESHSRHPRPSSNIGWRNGERSGRSRMLHERYRLLPDEAGFHDRFSSEVCP